MHRGGLAWAGDDDAGAAMSSEVLDNGFEPSGGNPVEAGNRPSTFAQALFNNIGQGLHLARPQWQSMVRDCSGNRRRAFYDIQPVHAAAFSRGSASVHKVAGIPDAARQDREEIAVQRENDV